MLTAYGVVTTTRGVKGGTMVKRLDATKVTSMLAISLDMLYQHEGCTAGEFLEVREQLEVPAARLAAERCTPEQLEALRSTLPSHVPASPDHDMSESFHKLIVEASGNRLLRVMTEPVFTLMQRRFPRRLAATQFWPVVDDDHGRIFDAIEQRDPYWAEHRDAFPSPRHLARGLHGDAGRRAAGQRDSPLRGASGRRGWPEAVEAGDLLEGDADAVSSSSSRHGAAASCTPVGRPASSRPPLGVRSPRLREAPRVGEQGQARGRGDHVRACQEGGDG